VVKCDPISGAVGNFHCNGDHSKLLDKLKIPDETQNAYQLTGLTDADHDLLGVWTIKVSFSMATKPQFDYFMKI
jgi:hypothetical protein